MSGQLQLAALLFCDVVGSTETLVQEGEAHWDALRRRLDVAVRAAVARHRGRVVKGLGDGAMAAFDAPSDALSAGIAIQQAIRRDGGPEVRIGISAGEVTDDEGDLFGTPVVEAARLCAAAASGQILASAPAALLARRGAAELLPVGPLALKGFAEPLDAFEVLWEVAPEPAATAIVPESLRTQARFAFVARPAEWEALADAAQAVRDGGRHLVLVRGEAGAGKTRLVTEFVRAQAEAGATVLYGACRESGAGSYAPIVEALEHLFNNAEALGIGNIERHRERVRTLLASSSTGALTFDPSIDVGLDERVGLFEGVCDILADAGAHAPVFLVVDDAHWAGRPMLQLVLHLLRTPAPLRCCIIATHRDTPGDIGNALYDVLPEMHRLDGITHVPVAGLDEHGVAAFVEAAAGCELDSTLGGAASVLLRQTDGNPFLLGELWRHLLETGALSRDPTGRWHIEAAADGPVSPATVRSVVGQRIDRLPERSREVLEVAAIAGSRFSLDVVGRAATVEPAALLELLEPAVAGGTVEETGRGEYQFSHALVWRAIYDRVPTSRRTQLHRAIALAIEDTGVNDATLPELARHYVAAVPVVDRTIAIDTGVMAAEAAMRSFAYEDAVGLLEQVLPLVEEPVARAEVLLRLAAANLPAGDTNAVIDQARDVADVARRDGRPDLFRRAVLLLEDATWRLGLPGTEAERLVREAIADAPDEATRIRLLAARGRALALSGEPTAGLVIEDAISAAREHGDPDLLWYALQSWFNIPWRPENYALMLDRALELCVLTSGNLRERAYMQQWLIASLMVQGRFDEAREAVVEHRRQISRTREPFQLHLRTAGDSVWAMMSGDFATAEALAEEANELAQIVSGTDVSGAYGVQMFSIRREQGRLDEVRPVVEAVVRLNRAHAAWRPGLASVYAELGMIDEARAEIDYLVEPGLLRIPRDSLFEACLTYLADAIAVVGDRRAAAIVYSELEPYRGTVVIIGHAIACYGSTDRYLGLLAETAGRARDAERHYVRAVEIDTGLTAPVWAAHSRYCYARFLARQGRRDGPQRAAALLADVLATARGFGMRSLEARATQLADELATPVTVPEPTATATTRLAVDLTPREREILTCLVDGLSNAEIGRTLHCSPNTAANHVRSILMKTGCANRTEAAAWAVRNGFVTNS